MENKNRKIRSYIISIIIIVISSFTIYNIATVNKTYYKGEKELYIPIFIYHDIVSDESEIEYEYMQTTYKTFEKQISGLKGLGYNFITYEDLKLYNKGEKALPKKSCILTFDDGWDGVYTYAYPVIKKYNVPITSFVVNYLVGTEGYFTWEQAKEMNSSGLVEIASHSIDHEKFDKKTVEEAVNDINLSYRQIMEEVNITEKIFTYPCGIYTEEQVKALKNEGYIQNLTDNRINNTSNLDLSKLHRCYPLSDSVLEILVKVFYRSLRYK